MLIDTITLGSKAEAPEHLNIAVILYKNGVKVWKKTLITMAETITPGEDRQFDVDVEADSATIVRYDVYYQGHYLLLNGVHYDIPKTPYRVWAHENLSLKTLSLWWKGLAGWQKVIVLTTSVGSIIIGGASVLKKR